MDSFRGLRAIKTDISVALSGLDMSGTNIVHESARFARLTSEVSPALLFPEFIAGNSKQMNMNLAHYFEMNSGNRDYIELLGCLDSDIAMKYFSEEDFFFLASKTSDSASTAFAESGVSQFKIANMILKYEEKFGPESTKEFLFGDSGDSNRNSFAVVIAHANDNIKELINYTIDFLERTEREENGLNQSQFDCAIRSFLDYSADSKHHYADENAVEESLNKDEPKDVLMSLLKSLVKVRESDLVTANELIQLNSPDMREVLLEIFTYSGKHLHNQTSLLKEPTINRVFEEEFSSNELIAGKGDAKFWILAETLRQIVSYMPEDNFTKLFSDSKDSAVPSAFITNDGYICNDILEKISLMNSFVLKTKVIGQIATSCYPETVGLVTTQINELLELREPDLANELIDTVKGNYKFEELLELIDNESVIKFISDRYCMNTVLDPEEDAYKELKTSIFNKLKK